MYAIIILIITYSGNRLRDFVVYTTSSMPQRGDPAPSEHDPGSQVCGRQVGVAATAVFTVIFCMRPTSSRYVVVQIPGSGECLTVCELEIYSKSSGILTIRQYKSH